MTQRVPFKWLSNAGPARHAENCLQEQKAEQAAKLHRKQAWQRLEEAVAGVCRLSLQLSNRKVPVSGIAVR